MGSVEGRLIVVRQLPEIEERLRTVKESVDERVSRALEMVCTEETVQAVKAERAKLRQEFDILEDQRKAAKKAVLEPYERFEAVYKACVSDAFQRADAELKGKINDVETEMKRRCEDSLREYFCELCAVHHLDWLSYEQAGVRVDMASAKDKTPKKLREQLAAFVAGVAESVDRINSLEDAGEIMVEYQRTLDAADAICTVKERHRRIEEQRQFQEARSAIRAQEAEMVRRVEALAPPVAVEAPKTVKCTFIVRTTMDKLKKLKEFLNMEGIQYE